MKRNLIAAACLWTGGLGALPAQTLEIGPPVVMADGTAVIRAKGLQPNERTTIRAELEDGTGHRWASQAEFTADAQGAVDVSKQAPVGGSYKGVSAMGLIWSMRPLEKTVAMYQAPRSLGPQTIELQLMRKGERISTARLEQVTISEGVQQIPVRDGTLRGVLFLPGSRERKPGVLVVGGSNGGVPSRKAAWLASHGFAALALAYFRYGDLPAMLEGIPLEYFERALIWMAQRPEIKGDRLGILGTSRGGELALQVASMFPQIGAVVGYVPAGVRYPACCGGNTRVPYAWTWRGSPLPYLPLRFTRDPRMMTEATIAVENAKAPVLLISGEDDGVWSSSAMSDGVIARLKKAHFPYRFEHLKYPQAGHLAGNPGIVPAWHARVMQAVSGRESDLGGSAEGDAQSSIDATPKVIEFLRQSLQSRPPEQ